MLIAGSAAMGFGGRRLREGLLEGVTFSFAALAAFTHPPLERAFVVKFEHSPYRGCPSHRHPKK
jgi:hypothetical protein